MEELTEEERRGTQAAREQAAEQRHKIETLINIFPEDRSSDQDDLLLALLTQEIPVFQRLKESSVNLKGLQKHLEMMYFEKDDVLIHEGQDEMTEVFIVFSGFVGVYKKKNTETAKLAKAVPGQKNYSETKDDMYLGDLGMGQVVGDLLLLYNIPSQITIKTNEYSKLISISMEGF